MTIDISFSETDVYEYARTLYNRKQLRRFLKTKKLLYKMFGKRNRHIADEFSRYVKYNPIFAQTYGFSFNNVQKKFSAHHTFPVGIYYRSL